MMRSIPKVVFVVVLVAAIAAVGLVAGCGDEGTSSSASPSAAASVDKTQAFKVGITQVLPHPALDAAVTRFKAALVEKGFTNVTYDMQNAQGEPANAASIAQKFAGEDLDLILGVGTSASQAVVKAITTTPIVFTAVTDPVGSGLVADAEAPSANVTGVSDMQPVQPVLDLVKQFRPDAKAVGAVYNAGESNSVFLIKAEKEAAAAMGLKFVEATAAQTSDVQAAAQSLVGRVDAITVIGDNTAVTALESIVKVCDQNKIPLLVGDTDSVKRGAVAGYGFDYGEELGKQAGDMAAQILSGTPIKDLPVQFAQNLQFSINEKAAQAQGVTIPADLLSEAANKF
jgi:putative tryptophan/tyrosine transport system substrate-binding protein